MSSFDMTSQRFFRTDGANQYVEWAIGASDARASITRS